MQNITRSVIITLACSSVYVGSSLDAHAADGCAPGTSCLNVTADGLTSPQPSPAVAQCRGHFPDFIVASNQVPIGGPWFRLSQNYPKNIPPNDATWLSIDFKNGTTGGNLYLYALRDYAFEGMVEADFRAEANLVRQWYHMPMMNFGPGAGKREAIRGLTGERSVIGPELDVNPGTTIHNFAIGFYNARAGYTVGRVWSENTPDLTKATFVPGSMSFKVLFTDALPGDFHNGDILAGAPQWDIETSAGKKAVRLLQMDVAAVDARSPTGWVFGTFAYDRDAPDPISWRRMRPVGLSWGNDFGFTPNDQKAGKILLETTISDQIPSYAKAHLGWAGRANGPVDNPISGCLSCHSTAEYPIAAPLTFSAACDTDQKRMQWFRTLSPGSVFGAIEATTCQANSPIPSPQNLDLSLQLKVAVQNVLQFHAHNPCAPDAAINTLALPTGFENAARVER